MSDKEPPRPLIRKLTSDTSKELSGKTLDLAVRKGNELIAFEKIEDTLAQQVHDNADVASVVEAVAKMYATIPIFRVVRFQRR